MRFGVLTAKHHDGFCLWPTRHTAYNSGRDIVREYVHAFRSRGLTPCLYFSIWDRTNGVGPKGSDGPLTLDLGRVHDIDVLTYLPRQDTAKDYVLEDFTTTGNITSYRVSVSTNGRSYRTVAHGTWPADHALKHARFRPAAARYVRLEALAAHGGGPAIVSEVGCGRL